MLKFSKWYQGWLTRCREFLNTKLRSPLLLLWLADLYKHFLRQVNSTRRNSQSLEMKSWLFIELKRDSASNQLNRSETHRSILSWVMIVWNIIRLIMPENWRFEWIFLEPSRWKWLNMEIFRLSLSNWLLQDKELRGKIEIEGECDCRLSWFANCNGKFICSQHF